MHPSISLTWAAVAGFRFDHDDPKIRELVTLMSKYMEKSMLVVGLLLAFPWLKKIFLRTSVWNTTHLMLVRIAELHTLRFNFSCMKSDVYFPLQL